MSFEKQFDRGIDKASVSLEKGIASFSYKVGQGLKKMQYQRETRNKFLKICAVLLIISISIEFLAHMKDWKQHYHLIALIYKIPYVPWPLGIFLFLISSLISLSMIGGSEGEIHKKFKLAFERVGLSSSRRISINQEIQPEYPLLYKQFQDTDGGMIYIFLNPGISFDKWQKAKPSLEATLQQSIDQITLYQNNPGYIQIKLGGSRIPAYVEYSEDLLKGCNATTVSIGVTKEGVIYHNFKKVPHLLIAGATGGGKSVITRFITYLTMKIHKANVWGIDFKGGIELQSFEPNGVEVIWDRERALQVLKRLKGEHDARIEKFKEVRVKNIDEYNENHARNEEGKLKRCYVVIDELAELTDKSGVPKEEKEIFEAIEGEMSSIARLCRATGIHLILATQRPSADVITGQIKTNVTGRISSYLQDIPASQIVLGNKMATEIPNEPGRMMYSVGNVPVEFQSPLFEDRHIDPHVKVDYSKGMLTSEDDFKSPVPSMNLNKKRTRAKYEDLEI
ncbi:MAG TPA: FtsK/SpoIIIE domain-containing protein [Bacillota bacterium]|nr:FtsK/SpoIIIE domain-containing protein [Bacillota bacterium]